jgi:prepilin signal peptidase PulO-like enzyme (type II secretory pathway)
MALLFVFKLIISFIDVHTITLKRRLNRPLIISFKGKNVLILLLR